MSLQVNPIADLKLSITPTPLWVYLYFYTKSTHECYINYMDGAKCLYNYFTTNGRFPLDFQEELYPEIGDTSFQVPTLLSGYSSSQLSGIITGSRPAALTEGSVREWLAAMRRTDRAIYITMLRKVLPCL